MKKRVADAADHAIRVWIHVLGSKMTTREKREAMIDLAAAFAAVNRAVDQQLDTDEEAD